MQKKVSNEKVIFIEEMSNYCDNYYVTWNPVNITNNNQNKSKMCDS